MLKNKTEPARTLVGSAFTTNYSRNTPLRRQYRRRRPHRLCGNTVLRTGRPRDSTRRRRPLDAPEVRLRRELPNFPPESSREHRSYWHENTSNGPRVRSKMGPSGPSPRRTGRSGSNSTARRSMPTTSSWPRGPIATFSRRSASKLNRNRTARSKRSSRTGTVELASTESGQWDALRAPGTGRPSVRGAAHGSP